MAGAGACHPLVTWFRSMTSQVARPSERVGSVTSHRSVRCGASRSSASTHTPSGRWVSTSAIWRGRDVRSKAAPVTRRFSGKVAGYIAVPMTTVPINHAIQLRTSHRGPDRTAVSPGTWRDRRPIGSAVAGPQLDRVVDRDGRHRYGDVSGDLPAEPPRHRGRLRADVAAPPDRGRADPSPTRRVRRGRRSDRPAPAPAPAIAFADAKALGFRQVLREGPIVLMSRDGAVDPRCTVR